MLQVYADNAATTKMSKTALEAMIACSEQYYGNPSSLHSVGQEAKEVLEDCRARLAAILGCEARDATIRRYRDLYHPRPLLPRQHCRLDS